MPVVGQVERVDAPVTRGGPARRLILVTAAVIRRGRRILIARRAGDDALAGMWEFPGGKLHPGESPEACLVREIMEELGLEVAVVRSLGANEHRYPERTVRLLFYEAEPISGRVKLSAHDRFAWVIPAEMPGYEFAPADRPLVDHIVPNNKVVPLPGVQVESVGLKRRRARRQPSPES